MTISINCFRSKTFIKHFLMHEIVDNITSMIKFVFIPDKNRNAFTKMFHSNHTNRPFQSLLVIESYSKKFLRLHAVCVAKQVSVCLTSVEMIMSFHIISICATHHISLYDKY